MAKSGKEQPGGVDPSAVSAGGTADSKSESAAAAVDRLGPDQADGAVRAEVVTAIDEADAASEALRELTEQDHADELFDEVPKMSAFIGMYHTKIEKLARHFSRDAKMHVRLTRMAHLFAEFRNGLANV